MAKPAHIEAQRLMDVYRNTLDARAFCETVAGDLRADYVTLAWYTGNRTWYIPYTYHGKALSDCSTSSDPDEKQENLGPWVIEQRPCRDSLPVFPPTTARFEKLGEHYLIYNGTDLDPYYEFVCESFINTLAQNHKVKSQTIRSEILLNHVCHGIRTPLNGILNMTNMLQNTEDTQGVQSERLRAEHLRCLNRSAMSLAHNIFDIMDVTKLDLGTLKMEKVVCNLPELFNQIIGIARTLDRESEVRFQHHIAPGIPDFAYTDPKRVTQVLVNILDNAFRYTNTGNVSLMIYASPVSLDEDESDAEAGPDRKDDEALGHYQISFVIQDTGRGMTPEQRQILFKPPEVLENSKQYGISLRISYLLAQHLGGDLYLKSSGAHGSSFQFDLIASEEAPPVHESITLKTLKGRRALLIEDSNDRIPLAQAVRQCQMDYVIASSYAEILSLHIEEKFDVVICKTALRRESGVNICMELGERWPQTYFIAVATEPSALPKGVFDEVVVPPVKPAQIKYKLMELFQQKPQQKRDSLPYVLAVDDERVNRIILERQLTQEGFQKVDTAASGEEALKCLQAQPGYYTVIIIDLKMDGMDGAVLADKIHEWYEARGEPTPHLIGVTSRMVLESEKKDYFKDFVCKPVDIRELTDVIHSRGHGSAP
jgi:signal transduction histidine kinase/DNA-binding response OmpR family regulator